MAKKRKSTHKSSSTKSQHSGSEHHVHHHLPQMLNVLIVVVGVIVAVAALKMIQGTGTVGKAFGYDDSQPVYDPYGEDAMDMADIIDSLNPPDNYDPNTGEYVDMPDDTSSSSDIDEMGSGPIDRCIFDCWEDTVDIPDRKDCTSEGIVEDCTDGESCDPLKLGPVCRAHNIQVDEKFIEQTARAERVCPERCIPSCADAAEQLNFNKGECNSNKPGPGWTSVKIHEGVRVFEPTCPEGKKCFGARDVCELGDVREGFIDQEKYENPDCRFSTPESPDHGGFWKEFGKADCKYEGRSQMAGTCTAWKPTCTRDAILAEDPEAFGTSSPFEDAECVERNYLLALFRNRGFPSDKVESVLNHFYSEAYNALRYSVPNIYEAVKCDPKPGISGTYKCFLKVKQQCACKRDGSLNGIDCDARNNGNRKSVARCMTNPDVEQRLSDGNFRPHTMGIGYCDQHYQADYSVYCVQYLLGDCSMNGLTEQERSEYESVICATSSAVQQGLTDEEFGQQYEVISRIDCDERPESGRGDYNKRCFAKKIGSEQGVEGDTGDYAEQYAPPP